MRRRDPASLIDRVAAGDTTAVARLLSIVEQGGSESMLAGSLVYPLGGRTYTVGITGAPGAGKSTLTDQLITRGRAQEHRMAVLAIDPSSPYSGGAILGDRVRMSDHFLDPGVFIRSMATRGHLGGLSLAAPAAVRVLDAAGFPWVLLETVGVGQVEVEIAGAADTTVVVVNPGWGDAVQASKAGLMEIADIFVVNKADRAGVAETRADLEGMVEMSRGRDEWRPPVLTTTATEGTGVDALWRAVGDHRAMLARGGELTRRRGDRMRTELQRIVRRQIEHRVAELARQGRFATVEDEVIARRLDPYTAARAVLDAALAPARDDGPPDTTAG